MGMRTWTNINENYLNGIEDEKMGMRTHTYMRMKNGIEDCTCTQCIQVVYVCKCIMYKLYVLSVL